MKILQLVDTLAYVTTNSWQHQLLEAIGSQCVVHSIVELNQLTSPIDLTQFDVVLSTLKLRTILKHMGVVSKFMGDRELVVYEQDPWESFTDAATFPKAYERLYQGLNIKTFINTSQWWSDLVRSKGMPSSFVPMWVSPKYCDYGKDFFDRDVHVGFKGQLHPQRKKTIDSLKEHGIDVTVLPSGPFAEFLSDMSNMRFFFHEDAAVTWKFGGIETVASLPWAKEIEVAARGAFVIHKYEEEAKAYEIDKIPTVLCYNEMSEVPGLIDSIMRKSKEEIAAIQRVSVDFIRERGREGWPNLRTTLKACTMYTK